MNLCYIRFPHITYYVSHVFLGCMSPGAAVLVKSCGTKILANIRDGAFRRKIDHHTCLLRF